MIERRTAAANAQTWWIGLDDTRIPHVTQYVTIEKIEKCLDRDPSVHPVRRNQTI